MSLFDPETGELRQTGPSCGNCAQVISERIEAEHQLQIVERRLTQSLTEQTRLRNELERQRVGTPEGRVATALGRYWKTRCEKSKTTKVKDKRLKAVIGRLNDGYDPLYIAKAIDGAAVAAGVAKPEVQRLALLRVMEEAIRRVDKHTAAELRRIYKEAMKGVVRFNDLELICRDETKLERFHDLAERVNAPSLAGLAWREQFEQTTEEKREIPGNSEDEF